MTKVHIQVACSYCQGEAYVFHTQAGRYLPCEMCQGSGSQTRWVSLVEFVTMLDKAQAFEPDYAELASQVPGSQYRESRDAAGI